MERILSTQILDRLVDSMTAPIRDWLNAHPTGYWLVTHPLWLLGLILISLLLLSGLFGAIAQLTQKLWLLVLQAPLALARWMFTATFDLFTMLLRGQGKSTPPQLPNQQAHNQQARLTELLTRLEILKQEQDELLKEVKTILLDREFK